MQLVLQFTKPAAEATILRMCYVVIEGIMFCSRSTLTEVVADPGSADHIGVLGSSVQGEETFAAFAPVGEGFIGLALALLMANEERSVCKGMKWQCHCVLSQS